MSKNLVILVLLLGMVLSIGGVIVGSIGDRVSALEFDNQYLKDEIDQNLDSNMEILVVLEKLRQIHEHGNYGESGELLNLDLIELIERVQLKQRQGIEMANLLETKKVDELRTKWKSYEQEYCDGKCLDNLE